MQSWGAFNLCKGAKQDADDTENKDESTKSEDEADSRYTITAWEWVDEEGNLDPETGALVLSADEEEPCAFGDVEELLPKQITAQVMENEDAENTEDTPVTVEETIDLRNWECESYPEEGAYRGAYVFKASLPEGYALSEDAGELEVEVKFDTPQVLGEAAGYTKEGFCEGYSWVNGSLVKNSEEGTTQCTHTECNGYQPAVQITATNASEYGITGDNVTKYDGYYAITNAGQLYWFADYVNEWSNSNDTRTSKAVLTADITVNSSPLSDKLDESGTPKDGADIRNWVPIGYSPDYNSTFQGKFDGQNHTVSGIYFSDTSADKGVGLFGIMSGGTISNVTLTDSYFNGKENVGGICGKIGSYGGTIEYCTNQATVTGTENRVGGICGNNGTISNKQSTISNCKNSGAIRGASLVGGICGDFQNGTMQECNNSGDITGTNSIGGICGYFDANSTVSNCTNSGKISGAACVGGICGQNSSSNTITCCKNSGSVTGTATTTTTSEENGFIGGICGVNQGTITNCDNLADGAVNANSGASCVGGVCGRNTNKLENCTNAATVTGWDYLGGICGYNDGTNSAITSCKNSGTVKCAEAGTTTGSPISIGGICGANNSSDYIKGCTNNGAIEASSANKVGGICGENKGSIDKGSAGTANTNTANVIGGDKTGGICGYSSGRVSGTNSGVITGSGDYVGGICGNSKGSLSDCNNNSGTVSGVNYVGGICGGGKDITNCTNNASVTGSGQEVGGVCGDCDGIISGCTNEGPVNGNDKYVGGICGYSSSNIESSSNTASVEGKSDYVGGICGYNTGSSVKACTNSGTVIGEGNEVGGICGCKLNAGTVDGCKNTADVTGKKEKTGGVVGNCGAGITNCKNSGKVEGKDQYTGGIFGYNESNKKVENNDNSGEVSGTSYVGGISGYSLSSITTCSNTKAITATGDYAGGISGFAGATTAISYSYNTGRVSGKNYVGGIVGNSDTVSYAYNTGMVSGTDGNSVGVICGDGYATNENCYYLNTVKTDGVHQFIGNAISMTASDFSSGKVAWLLNDKSSDSPTWFQWIDADDKTKDSSPVLEINRDSAGSDEEGESTNYGIVYQCTPCTAYYSNKEDKNAEHGEGVALPSDNANATTMHKCSLCEQEVAHSGVVYKADTTNADTILASCSCGYEYGSIKIKAPDSLTYDGNAKGATIYTNRLDVPVGVTINPSDSDVTYKRIENETETSLNGQKPTDAGKYKATLTLEGTNRESAEVSVIYTIAQAAPTVEWSRASETAYYTGNAISPEKIPSLTITGVNDTAITGYDADDYTFSYRAYRAIAGGIGAGVGGSVLPSTASFEDGLPTEIGTYEIKATVKAKGNYKEAEVTETTGYLILEIKYLETDETATLTNQNGEPLTGNDWWAQSVTFKAPDNFTISQELFGTYDTSFTYEAETGASGQSVTYYLKNSNDEIAQKEAKVWIDRTAPTFPESGDYGIQIKENWFKSLLNKITFGRAYKNNVEVKVLAKEERSGIAAYYYCIDEKDASVSDVPVKTESELSGLDFTKVECNGSSGTVTVTTLANKDKTTKYVVYAYAEDKAGNKSNYICSDGVVVDDKAPSIALSEPKKDLGTLRDTSADITINSNEAGMYFYVYGKAGEINVSDYSSIGSFATGADANGRTTWTAKDNVKSGTMVAGNNTLSLTGLEVNTAYSLYAMAVDEAGNATATTEVCDFTTLKAMPTITVQPEISGTYGQKLSEMSLVKGKATYNNAEVAGTWAVSSGDADTYPIVDDTDTYEVVFKPTDTSYETITVEVSPTVAKKSITVTAENKTKTYGEENPELTFTVPEGALVSGDTVYELHITLSCSATKDSPVRANGYAITGTSNSANYAVTVNPGTLTINKADPELEVTNGDSSATANTVSFTKTFGDGSFAIETSSKNKATPITYQVTYSRTIDNNQPMSDDEVVTVDASGKVTIVGPGKANIIVSQAESTNYKAATNYTVEITVNKKTAPANVTITKNYKKGTDVTDTLNLKPYLPKDCGSVSYGYGINGWMIDNGSNEGTSPKVTDGILSYAIKSASQSGSGMESNAGTITVTVKTANYANFTITVKVNLTDYAPIVIDSVEISDVTYSSAKVTAKAAEGSNLGNYYLYYTDTASGSIDAGTIQTNANLSSTSGSFSLTGLTSSTTYYVYVVAADAEGNLGTLQAVSFTTKETPKPSSGGGSGSSGGSSGNSGSNNNNNSNSNNTNAGSSSSSNESATNLSPVNGSSTATPTPTPVQPPLIPESRPSGEKTYPAYAPEVSEEEGDTDGKDKAPFIKGENGKEGWDVIRTETENTPEGSTVTVDMNGAVAVPREVLEDIRGRDVTLVFDMGNGITWRVNGQSITGDVTGDIDFGVTMGAQAGRSIPVDVINNVTGERTSLNLTLAYEGEFGFTAVLTVNMSAENAGLYANLFYYNPFTGELEFICCDEIAADGTTELTFTHASDYTIVIDTEPMDGSAKDDGDDAVKDSGSGSGSTDESSVAVATDVKPAWSPLWIILIGAVVIVIGIGGFLIVKRRRDE